jgi:iron(III) transport system ATP-binding protein
MLIGRGLAKRFPATPLPVQALRGVDLTVPRGSFTAILGPSGCGKTTLLRVIAGIERPDRGELIVGGQTFDDETTHVPPERRGMGLVPQDGVLFPHLDIAGNIGFGLPGRPLTIRARRERTARIDELLELVGLPGYGKRCPDELSGGQQQRVALARALAPRPSIVLLDEPFTALDAGLRLELRREVRELLRESGTTTILVTHDQEEALSLADHIVVMRDGLVAQCGSPREIYDTPADLGVASFLGDAVFLQAVIERDGDRVAHSALGPLPTRAACGATRRGPCTLLIRPEQLRLGSDGAPARVTDIAFYGHDGVLQLRLGDDGTGAAVAARTFGGESPRIGSLVHLRVNEDAVAYGGAMQ